MQKLEETINKLSDIILSNKGASSSNSELSPLKGHISDTEEEVLDHSNGEKQMFAPKAVELEFPRFSEDDPMVCHRRVE
ncbi:hypothetical protein PTKIN_Ptkin14bG0103100 [Pterospermum kingtungense]